MPKSPHSISLVLAELCDFAVRGVLYLRTGGFPKGNFPSLIIPESIDVYRL
jgi:hypothetical protein